jgi:hypothetical protein
MRSPQVLRRAAAGCFFAAGLVLTLISSFTSYLQTCTEQIARVGSVPTVRTCDSMSVENPVIWILVIAAGVCLLPEWGVFEIPGILRVEKKVEEQGRRQDAMLHLLQQINVSQNQKQDQKQNLTVAIISSLADLPGLSDAFNLRDIQPGGDQQ